MPVKKRAIAHLFDIFFQINAEPAENVIQNQQSLDVFMGTSIHKKN